MHFEIEHLEKVNLKKIYFIPATVFQHTYLSRYKATAWLHLIRDWLLGVQDTAVNRCKEETKWVIVLFQAC